MLRLPRLRYLEPKTAREAAAMAAELGPKAMLVAGGTDLYPNLKRRQFAPDTLIGLSQIGELRGIGGTTLGALTTLADAASAPGLRATHPGYAEAAGCSAVEVLPIDHDFFRFYRLTA